MKIISHYFNSFGGSTLRIEGTLPPYIQEVINAYSHQTEVGENYTSIHSTIKPFPVTEVFTALLKVRDDFDKHLERGLKEIEICAKSIRLNYCIEERKKELASCIDMAFSIGLYDCAGHLALWEKVVERLDKCKV